MATLSSGSNSVSIAALTSAGTGLAGTSYVQIRVTITGVAGLSGSTTVLASAVRDASTFGADTPFFPKPLSVELPGAGSSGVWVASAFTPPPVVNFIASVSSGVAPLSVTFTYTGNGSPSVIEWAYGSGTFAATGNTFSVTLPSVGTYRVTCRATNAGGQDVLSRPTCIVVS
jgi:PKD repeat protein